MNLGGALTIASASLLNINAQLAIVSNNVANANTPDYVAETGTQQALTDGVGGMGVRTGVTGRVIDVALQQATFRQDSVISGLTVTTASLQVIDAVQGTPGQGGDLSSLLGRVQDAFSSLLNDPANGAAQSAVMTAAGSLTGGIHALSGAYTDRRQAAQDDIVGAVGEANAALRQIGTLSGQIVAARAGGSSTADLENQRDATVHGLGALLGVRTLVQSNGDMLVTTASGTTLPTRADSGPLGTAGATIGPGAFYPGGGIPAITVNGVDITRQVRDGRIGANLGLRDKALPTFQGELDEFAQSLASRFDAQGLTLFTDPNGAVPAAGGTPVQASYVGFSATIQVSTLVVADPAQTRDGTHAVTGSAAGASAFTPNPAGGPASFSTLITRVLNYALGASTQTGVAQPAGATAGLGADGTLSAPYAPPATLAAHATALVTAQASESASASAQLSTEQAVRKNLNDKLTATSAVNVDREMARMIQLQNSYAASARIISTVQGLFTQLIQAL